MKNGYIMLLKIDDLKKLNHQQGETPIKFAKRFRYVRRMNELAQRFLPAFCSHKSPAKPPAAVGCCCENATLQRRGLFYCLEMKILESVQQASHTTRCAGMNLITARDAPQVTTTLFLFHSPNPEWGNYPAGVASSA